MSLALLLHQRHLDDDLRALPFLGLDAPLSADQPGPLQNALDPEMIPFFRVAQHGLHVEADAVVGDRDPQPLEIDVHVETKGGRLD